jgi:hypothetical protein
VQRGQHYVIGPILPELQGDWLAHRVLDREYSSGDELLSRDSVADLLRQRRLMVDDALKYEGEFLR